MQYIDTVGVHVQRKYQVRGREHRKTQRGGTYIPLMFKLFHAGIGGLENARSLNILRSGIERLPLLF